MSEPILHSDLTVQQINDGGRRADMAVKEVDSISEIFDVEYCDPKLVDFKVRAYIPQRISESEVNDYVAHENIAPKNRSIKYGSYTKRVKKYHTRAEYTSENVENNPDSVVADITEDLTNWAVDMKKYLAVGALKATHSSVTYATSLDNTFKKAYVILHDVLEARPWSGEQYLCLMPGILNLKLQDEVLALNGGNTALAILPQNEKMKAFQDYIGSWRGFGIKTPEGSNQFMQDDTYYYVFFLGKTNKGKNPVRCLRWKDVPLVKFEHHPLGSGILKDADGNIVADYNNQKGGIGCNLKGLLYYVQDDRFVLMCRIAKSAITPVDITSEIPADGDDDGSVYQTLDRLIVTGHGGATSASRVALAVTGANPSGDTLKNTKTVQLAANHDVIWSTSTPTLCSVDQNGLVTGKATSGTAKVKAFDGTSEVEISFTCAANS